MAGKKIFLPLFFLVFFLFVPFKAWADDYPPPPPDFGNPNILSVSNGAAFKEGWNFFTLGFDGCSAEGVLNELQANGGSALKLTNIFVRGTDSWQPYSFVNPDSNNKKIGSEDLVSFYSTINFSMQIDQSACANQSFQRQQEIEKVRQGSVAQSSFVDKIHELPLDLWNKLVTLLNNSNAQNPNNPVLDTLDVAGKATVNNLGITGNISQGYLSVNGMDTNLSAATINTLSGDLYIQNDLIGGVNFLSGKIVIDKNGNLTVSNTITAQKIQADILSLPKASGSSVLPANTASVDVKADIATQNSKILITPTTLTDKVLTVTNKAVGSFTVSVKTADSQDIRFDWFIIQ